MSSQVMVTAAPVPKGKNNRRTGVKTSVRAIKAKERQSEALEYRKRGHTFEEIAQWCGYRSAQAAHYAVKAAIQAIPKENAEDVLILETKRLDDLSIKLWERIENGDTFAIALMLQLHDRIAKLYGLARVSVAGDSAIPVDGAIDWTKAREMARQVLAERERALEARLRGQYGIPEEQPTKGT